MTFTDHVRVGGTTYDLHTDVERSGAREALAGVVGNRVRRTSTSRFSSRDGSLDLQMNPPGRDSEPGSLHNPSFCIDVPTSVATGAWSVSTPVERSSVPEKVVARAPTLQNQCLRGERQSMAALTVAHSKAGKGPLGDEPTRDPLRFG